MTNTFTVLHPGIERRAEARPQLAPRLASLAGKRVALLDNSKVNAGAILAAVAARLQKLGAAETRAWKKQHASHSGEKVIPGLLGWQPDLVLTGLGD